ncbi:hypothetical protein [Aquimarina sp. 2201CG5-10]|uniref:hypothetical protein n=1 Tax=Aquimarina callyspongiae TaxID=3098150 RepID=UPI002AB3B530|nr:hypothetical protein [Aquimarina sp. 2201CG5-10]MDY8138719.1 hypothetical protein [Aquimarina sp. 2201CG5-10]
MNSKPKYEPIAPDAVHVWRGFQTPEKTYEEFVDFLGSVFVPACSLLQPNIGLHGYVPSLPNHENKPATVPDQTALMFWESPEIYKAGFRTVAVRSYTSMHTLVYNTETSKSGFPIAYDGKLAVDQPYYLIDKKSDWMSGTVHHLVGYKKEDQSNEEFLNLINEWAKDYSSPNADGALLCVAEDYVVFWEHFPRQGRKPSSKFQKLANSVTPFLDETAKNFVLPAGLWDAWKGIDLIKENCINVQLDRP